MKTFWTFLLIIAALFCACSFTQVAPGHDPFVVEAERDLVTSWRVVDAFLAWEHTHRANVPPGVTAIANDLRVHFPSIVSSAETVIRSYKRSRTPELRADMQAWLVTVQTAMQQALRYLPTEHATKALVAQPKP